jgi:hypothetical protein
MNYERIYKCVNIAWLWLTGKFSTYLYVYAAYRISKLGTNELPEPTARVGQRNLAIFANAWPPFLFLKFNQFFSFWQAKIRTLLAKSSS